MDFRRKLQRAWKHTSRAITKPFVGANKGNLRQLDGILDKVIEGRITDPRKFATHELRHGAYDFSWLTLLTEDELQEMAGAWVAVFQSSIRGSTGQTGFAPLLGSAKRKVLLLETSDSAFWNDLQQIKDQYKALAVQRASGILTTIQTWLTTQRERVRTKVLHNRWVGEYITAYETIEAVYADATLHGATSDLDRKILAAGGVWRIVKIAAGSGKKVAKMVVAPNPSTAIKLVKSGASTLNILGGLAAGLTDLIRDKEVHFERLSARFGLDQKLDELKKRYLGPGVIAAGDTLQAQMLAGPARLDRAGNIMLADLEELRDTFRHALWWTKVWRKDIEEMRADLEESAVTKHLRHLFRHVTAEEGVVKPSQLAQVEAYVEPDRQAVEKEIERLEARVQRFEKLIGDRLRKMDELLAGYETRRSIARQQKRSALIRTQSTSGSSPVSLNYDIQRQLAHEIRDFDRTSLRAPRPRRTSSKKTDGESEPLTLHQMVTAALAERRQYVGPPDEDDDS